MADNLVDRRRLLIGGLAISGALSLMGCGARRVTDSDVDRLVRNELAIGADTTQIEKFFRKHHIV
ncbi:MAG: hypothetical protein ABSC92_13630, partial [Rhizomicrobium sp.]